MNTTARKPIKGVKGKRLVFKESDAISSEGEIAKGWYLLLKGRVAVYKKNLKVAEFAKKGEVFGELSGILNQPRTATLKALEKTEVLFIKGGLDTLITDHPRVARKLMVNLAERLSETTDHWWMSVKDQKGKTRA